jgi:hypothetical protein
MSKNRYQVLPGSSSACGYIGRPTSLNTMSLLAPTPRKRQKASKVEPRIKMDSLIKAEPLIKSEVKDDPTPTPATVRRSHLRPDLRRKEEWCHSHSSSSRSNR